MEIPNRKKVDNAAKHFMESAVKNGVSVLLINRFLRESNYDSDTTMIHCILENCNIPPYIDNCSPKTNVWRRYLTNIFEIPDLKTFEQFKEVAFQEAIDYYNIDEAAFTKYWYDLCQFHNHFIFEIENPPDIEWIQQGLLYFGYTFAGLSRKLNTKNIPTDRKALQDIYKDEILKNISAFDQEFKFCPIVQANKQIHDFWESSYGIEKDIDTIIKWTEIFIGLEPTKSNVKLRLNLG